MIHANSNAGIKNVFLMAVRIYDTHFDRIMTKFFDMNFLTTEIPILLRLMFQSDENFFTVHNTCCDNCMAIVMNKTNTNSGDHNFVKTRARAKMKT